MRIELSRFDDNGAVSATYLDLTPAEMAAIVGRAHEVARLRRDGQPYEDALTQLDGAFEGVSVKTGPAIAAETSVTPSLVDSIAALRQSTASDQADERRVSVSRDALDAVDTALQEAVSPGKADWKWVSTRRGESVEVKSQDAADVLRKMSQVTRDAGAPTIKEAMAKYPLQFSAAFAALVEEEERERSERSTTIVHLSDEQNGETMMSIVAPAGMSEEAVRDVVQAAVIKGGDVDGIAAQLHASGFEPVEHVTVVVPPPPRDDEGDNFDSPSPLR
ncbi:hypothetical protein [Duganella sp. LjRoot269]|uniref:hypothetical protein n=1 Tax=Duganella sp. LjRoot269 TaxID=3342305 RepID=UPI003ECD2B1F